MSRTNRDYDKWVDWLNDFGIKRARGQYNKTLVPYAPYLKERSKKLNRAQTRKYIHLINVYSEDEYFYPNKLASELNHIFYD